MLDVKVSLGDDVKLLMLLVADTYEGSNIFGLDWYDAFSDTSDRVFEVKEIPIQNLRQKFPKLFSNSLGCCNLFKAHLKLKENSEPKFSKARQIPFAIHERFKKEAKRLQDLGIWKPVS